MERVTEILIECNRLMREADALKLESDSLSAPTHSNVARLEAIANRMRDI